MSKLRLPEQLDIRRIADVHRELCAALSAASATRVLDAAGVTRIDTAGVQLLAAALSGRSDARLTLADPAPCVVEAFEAAGLAHLLYS